MVRHKGWRPQWFWATVLAVLVALGCLLPTYRQKLYQALSPNDKQLMVTVTSYSLDTQLNLTPFQLKQCDIALLDLLCAQGLLGAERIDVSNCLATLDQWAQRVQTETDRNFHQFRENPAGFDNSEGYFRMLMMAVVMYEDFGIRYNPDRITLPGEVDPNDRFFANAQDIFLNGLMENGRGILAAN